MFRSLTKAEDVANVINLYTDRLYSKRDNPLQLEEQHPTITFQYGEHADPGVEIESSLFDSGVIPWHSHQFIFNHIRLLALMLSLGIFSSKSQNVILWRCLL